MIVADQCKDARLGEQSAFLITQRNTMSPILLFIQKRLRWHFIGSTSFEILKSAHQFALFMALHSSKYGQIGSLFALMYLSVHIFSFEAGNALVPFANSIAHAVNREDILNRFLILPQLVITILGGIILHTSITRIFLPDPHPLYITLVVAISSMEGIRGSLRSLAYTIAEARPIIQAEIIITTSYFAFIWIAYLLFGMPLNIQSILIPFLVSSIIGVIYLLNIVYFCPTQLPRLRNPVLPTLKQNIEARISLTMLHLPKNLFSSNFLVPFFAQTVSLDLAGIMKLASEIAQAIKSIIKSSIGYSANAVFSTFVTNRTEAFNMLWCTLTNGLIAACIISLIGASPCFTDSQLYSHGILLASFSLIYIIDYLYVLYEHFFIVANKSSIVAKYRFTEAAISAIIIMSARNKPFVVIGILILTRLISLTLTIWKTHQLWNIRPRLKVKGRAIATSLGIGLCIAMVCGYKKNAAYNKPQCTCVSCAPSSPFLGIKHLTE